MMLLRDHIVKEDQVLLEGLRRIALRLKIAKLKPVEKVGTNSQIDLGHRLPVGSPETSCDGGTCGSLQIFTTTSSSDSLWKGRTPVSAR